MGLNDWDIFQKTQPNQPNGPKQTFYKIRINFEIVRIATQLKRDKQNTPVIQNNAD